MLLPPRPGSPARRRGRGWGRPRRPSPQGATARPGRVTAEQAAESHTNFPLSRLRGPTRGRAGGDGAPGAGLRCRADARGAGRPAGGRTSWCHEHGARGGHGAEQREGRAPGDPAGSGTRPAAAAAGPEGASRKGRRQGTAPQPSPYRVVDPPHQDAQQRVAGSEQLHFLRYEALLLGLGRQDGPQVAGGRHGRRRAPAPEAGDPPSLHPGPSGQPHPLGGSPGAPCPLPLAAAARARSARLGLQAAPAQLAPGPAPTPAAAPLSPRLDQARGERLPRWAPAS